MALTIDQFMWEWQPHFRIAVQTRVAMALEVVEAPLDPQVFLVGFADDPSLARHPICVEPETGPLQPEHFSRVAERAEEVFAADPERLIFHSHPGLHEARQRWLRRRARAVAIAESVDLSEAMPSKRVIVSSAGHVSGFEVHSCVAINRALFDALPRLDGDEVNRFPAPGSFVGHLLDLILQEADLALGQRSPDMGAIRRRDKDFVSQAAENFVAGCSFRTGNFLPLRMDDVTAISQRVYESAAAAGRLLLVSPDCDTLDVTTRLRLPIPLQRGRAVRKLLEMTNDDVALLVHGEGVFGLGRITDDAVADVFEISVVSHATWELRNCGIGLLRVGYGVPRLPTPIFDSVEMVDTLSRVLGDEVDVGVLLPLVGAATTASHGTTLVVSADAAAEAERLSGHATLVEPATLTSASVARYAQIDGAVLVDTLGTCFAIGVILDGAADGQGDPSRGARYNSAVRYQSSAPAAAVVVVVSEDGDVTTVPSLPPRVHRQDVLDAMTLLESASTSEARGQFADAYERVRRLRFYLSDEQAQRANELAQLDHDGALAVGAVAIVRIALAADPRLNDSYFLD